MDWRIISVIFLITSAGLAKFEIAGSIVNVDYHIIGDQVTPTELHLSGYLYSRSIDIDDLEVEYWIKLQDRLIASGSIPLGTIEAGRYIEINQTVKFSQSVDPLKDYPTMGGKIKWSVWSIPIWLYIPDSLVGVAISKITS